MAIKIIKVQNIYTNETFLVRFYGTNVPVSGASVVVFGRLESSLSEQYWLGSVVQTDFAQRHLGDLDYRNYEDYEVVSVVDFTEFTQKHKLFLRLDTISDALEFKIKAFEQQFLYETLAKMTQKQQR